ncbi:DUF5994 family protein [Amycolatopsis dongchuanensis]|uniref:Uncharacterized protein n=1 Tax=Amycolatopsis dongchuanensis TaxID=1070866 RepID=A0ABP9QYL6_9PSEU
MKPAYAVGLVDGGWWPWSVDPATELPRLAVALTERLGPIGRVRYNLGAWGPMTRQVRVAGRVVCFEGTDSLDSHTVVVIGSNSHLARVLVIPPSTRGGVARAVLRAASGSGSTDRGEDILASNGIILDPSGH